MQGGGRGLCQPKRPIRDLAQVEVGVANGVDGNCHYNDADYVEHDASFYLHTVIKKSKTEIILLAFQKRNQNTQEVSNGRFLMSTRQNNKVLPSLYQYYRYHRTDDASVIVTFSSFYENSKTEMNASVQETNQNTQEVRNERFLISTRPNQCANFRQMLPSTKRNNGQTDIKHEMGKTLGSMSLLKIVGKIKAPSLAKIEFGNDKSEKAVTRQG